MNFFGLRNSFECPFEILALLPWLTQIATLCFLTLHLFQSLLVLYHDFMSQNQEGDMLEEWTVAMVISPGLTAK